MQIGGREWVKRYERMWEGSNRMSGWRPACGKRSDWKVGGKGWGEEWMKKRNEGKFELNIYGKNLQKLLEKNIIRRYLKRLKKGLNRIYMEWNYKNY